MIDLLLVEDDIIFSESLISFLEDEEYSLTWVKDGKEAINKIKNKSFDLFLFDINIPYIDGFTLLKMIRDENNDTPCIFLTAKVNTDSVVEGLRIGANDYIKKPFEPDELLARIENLTKNLKSFIKYGDITYDIHTKLAKNGNTIIPIPKQEMILFDYLIQHIDEAIHEDTLYALLKPQYNTENIIPIISSLRSKGLKIKKIRAQNSYICLNHSKLPKKRIR